MKINNPFERKEKRDFVPLSLFPASKTTKTSFQVGRATPVYCLDMMQGNKVKLDVSQLSRFAALSKPLMNNFEVSYGAYFVPYRALDGFFDSYYMMDEIANFNNPSVNRAILHADQFFDASRPDSTRVHPITVSKEILAGTKMIGGLADHLGYRTYESNILSVNPWALDDAELSYTFGDIVGDLTRSKIITWGSSLDLRLQFNPNDCGYYNKNGDDWFIFPRAVWLAKQVMSAEDFQIIDDEGEIVSFTEDGRLNGFDGQYFIPISLKVAKYLAMCGVPVASGTATNLINAIDNRVVKEVLGDATLDDMLSTSYDHMLSRVMIDAYFNRGYGFAIPEANVIRYLAYMRIYSDWFLPENFCKADDFRDIIGWAYLKRVAVGDESNDLTYYFGNSNPMYMKHSLKPYKFFQPYLQRCECLPVLWEKNYFTAMRSDLSINGENRTDFKYSGNGVADTPVGSTIREHYFNRMFQRFKDLIARLGYDSRKNTSAIYGFSEDDKSLRSSVSLGTHTFDVQVGDIAQTSESSENGSLGQFAGMAISRGNGGSWEWTAGTNGVFMILAYIRPKGVSFMNACDRSIFKKDYYDYLIPQFGGVGYQDVRGEEFAGNLKGLKIGNVEQYFEYMMVNNECSGLMRSSALDYHCDRDLRDFNVTNGVGIAPLFITERDKVNRIFNNTNEDTDPILSIMYFNGSVTRQLPEHIELDF